MMLCAAGGPWHSSAPFLGGVPEELRGIIVGLKINGFVHTVTPPFGSESGWFSPLVNFAFQVVDPQTRFIFCQDLLLNFVGMTRFVLSFCSMSAFVRFCPTPLAHLPQRTRTVS